MVSLVAEGFPILPTTTMPGLCLSNSGAHRRDGGESGEQPAMNGPTRGRRRQQGTPLSIGAGSYCNQSTGESFSWGVLCEVMLPVVLRQECQERRMDLFEVMRANPDDAACVLSTTKRCKARGGGGSAGAAGAVGF
jgi:hypothetical protein